MPGRLKPEDTSIVIGTMCTNLCSGNSILMWYYACRYSLLFQLCMHALQFYYHTGPSCIYNSAMLLVFRMSFFSISLPYLRLQLCHINQGMSCKVCIQWSFYYRTFSGVMSGFPSPLSHRPLQLPIGHCYLPKNSFSNISNFSFFTCANENYQLILAFNDSSCCHWYPALNDTIVRNHFYNCVACLPQAKFLVKFQMT